MLPTRPRSSVRSMWTSCTAPCSTTATRVSCGDQLIRMSWFMGWGSSKDGKAGRAQQLGGLEGGQAHDAGVAAGDAADPQARVALDGVGAGLAHGLAAL